MFIFVLFSFPSGQLGRLGHTKLLIKLARINYKFSDLTGVQAYTIFIFFIQTHGHSCDLLLEVNLKTGCHMNGDLKSFA